MNCNYRLHGKVPDDVKYFLNIVINYKVSVRTPILEGAKNVVSILTYEKIYCIMQFY